MRVTYRDTDRMGHVYYANYLVWFEIGRTELLREMGMCYRDWEEIHRIFLPVSSCSIDYRRSAQYDDQIRIETRITQITRATVTFSYEICHDVTQELLAKGQTKHAFVTEDGKIARVADKLLPQLFNL